MAAAVDMDVLLLELVFWVRTCPNTPLRSPLRSPILAPLDRYFSDLLNSSGPPSDPQPASSFLIGCEAGWFCHDQSESLSSGYRQHCRSGGGFSDLRAVEEIENISHSDLQCHTLTCLVHVKKKTQYQCNTSST